MFDESKLLLQFAAVSDLQYGYSSNRPHADTGERGVSCLRQLQALAQKYTSKGLDAVLFAGDLINNAKASQVEGFKEVYEAVLNPAEVPFIFCLGNHDVRSGKHYTKQELNMDVFYRIFGDAYRTYETATTDLQEGCIHQVVGGYHFLAINPLDTGYLCSVGDDSGAKYSEKAKLWLDKRLSEITAQVPEHYVFITTHPMIYGLAYGSELVYNNLYWYTKELVPILNKYPQVVAFGGHLHFPISDERTIMQDKITSINCGAMSYMAIENGNYRNMISGTVMADAWEVSNGHLVQVDEQGNVRIIRMNFALETTIKEPWVLPAPTSDGTHLQRYTKARGDAAHNLPPVLAEDAISVTDDGTDPLAVTLTFLSGSDDDEIHCYEAIITENGEEVEKIRLLADSYLRANPQDMKTSWTVALKENTYQKGHTYTVTLNAYDCWDGKSNDVVYTYTPE